MSNVSNGSSVSTDLSVCNKQTAQLRMLNEVSTRLQSLLNVENFFQEIVDIIHNKFDYFSLTIWEVEAEGITLKARAGAHATHLEVGYRLPRHLAGIMGHVLTTKKSYLSNDVSIDPKYSSLSLPIHSRAELCVPILKDNQVLALFNVESDKSNSFDAEDTMALEAVACQVAVAMVNRKLFVETRDFNRKLYQTVQEKTEELRKANDRVLMQQRLLKRENQVLKNIVNKDHPNEIVGTSPALRNILTMVDKIAPTPANVLILGESGTGKELIARRLHNHSDRANAPYVTVNCGALQESLLESELFGHEKGSFTGAIQQKVGLVETADDGTIFLDEIGEMSLGIQAKLLRFLQDGEFYRIGGKRPLSVNVRIISATNRDLELAVEEGRFREDLFYRLNTIALRMPPLRKRKEDIPQLAEHFLKVFSSAGGQVIKRVDPRVMDAFQAYEWPGNIRELQNTLERLKILAEGNEIRLEDVPFNIRVPKSRGESFELHHEMSLDEVEKSHILRVLAYHRGNKTRAAQSLGITIKTLYNKLHQFGILRPPGVALVNAAESKKDVAETQPIEGVENSTGS